MSASAAVHCLTRPGGGPPPAVISVCAPLGSGITRLLTTWASEFHGPAARLDADVDIPPGRLEQALCAAIAKASGASETASTFDDALKSLQGRRHLMLIDNADCITHARDIAALGYLASSMPIGSTLVVGGTSLPGLPWSRLRLEERLVELEQKDLLLRASDLVGEGFRVDEAQRLVDVTGGWPTAVALAAGLDAETAVSEVRSLLAFRLSALADELRPMLATVALLGSTDLDLLAEATRGDTSALVKGLRVAELPLVDVPRGAEPTLSVREPLRSMLVDELRSDHAHGEAVTGRAVRTLVSRGRDDDAFHVLRRWGDRQAMARLAYERGAHLALAGRPDAALSWVPVFTDEEIAADRGLQLSVAIAKAVSGDFTTLDQWVLAIATRRGGFPWDDELPAGELERSISADRSSRSTTPVDPAALPWLVLGQAYKAVDEAFAGRLAEAESTLTALSAFTRGYAMVDMLRCVGLGYIYARTRRPQLGVAVVDFAAERAEREGLSDHLWLLSLDAIRSYYATVAGDQRGAIALLQAGIAKLGAFQRGVTGLRFYAATELTRTALWLHDVETARTLAAEAEDLRSAVPELRTVLAELDQVQAQLRAHDHQDSARLTPAELRVLRQLTGPATIPEIAAALFVSPATVRAQIRSLHRKLGTHDRAGTVITARARGLL